MVCHECGRSMEPGDRFCTGCGIPARPAEPDDGATNDGAIDDATDDVDEPGETSVSEPTGVETPEPDLADTALVAAVPDDENAWDGDDPVWAITGAQAATEAPAVRTGEMRPTEPITEVWMTPVAEATEPPVVEPKPEPTLYDFTQDEPAMPPPVATAQMPVVAQTAPAPQRGFRFSVVTLIGLIGAIVTLLSMFTQVIEITSDRRLTPDENMPDAFRTGTWFVDDLADNLSIAGLIAALLMVVGGIAAGFRWRWGSGLAAGGGIAFAGVSAIILGLAQMPIDAAHEFAQIPPDEPFVLTITRDTGYWLIVAAAAIGVVLFFASLNDAMNDHRPGLNPWIAALGALSAVVMAVGPLVPEGNAVFSDNWYVADSPGAAPALLLAGRLVQLGLLMMTGVFGFLMVRRYGLGLAIGGALPAIWMAISVLFDLTDNPVGPAFRNPGAGGMHLHGITIIGVSAMVGMSILAVIAAYDQGVRERPD